MYIIKYSQNNGYRETFESLKDLKSYIESGGIRKYISSIKEVSNVYEDSKIDDLLNCKLTRRDSKFSFEDLIHYSDMRLQVTEARRLVKQTDDFLLQRMLVDNANEKWSELCKWLDEEV